MKKIYLDNNASTLLDPAVVQVMKAHLTAEFANPSSPHQFGRQAAHVLAAARRTIASYLGVRPRDVLFTSSGTEAVNLFIRGVCQWQSPGHIVTCSVEHSCVYATVQEMEKLGWKASFLAPGPQGAVLAEDLRDAIRPSTRLIVFMAVNNETGAKTDIDAIAAVAQEQGIPLLIDGVAWLGKELLHLPPGVSAIAFSGHKIHGPKGIGLLVFKQRVKLTPQITGGGQEFGKRAGTENLLAIVGMAKAIDLLRTVLPEASERMACLRDRLEQGILECCSDTLINAVDARIANTTNLSFLGVDGESLLINLDQQFVAVSHGSACSAGALEPSRVLINMGFSLERVRGSLRFSLSRFTTEQEIERTIQIVKEQVERLRN